MQFQIGCNFAGTLIATLGSIEYLSPEARSLLGDFMKEGPVYILAFLRATYSFFGNDNATFICALTLPLILPPLSWYRSWTLRFPLILSAIIIIYGIYIGGHRSIWVILFLAALTVGLFQRKLHTAIYIGVAIIIVISLLPTEGVQRLSTLQGLLEGDTTDHSLIERSSRDTNGLNMALETPFGSGWSAAGWVHNDFVQLWADTGIFSAIIFVVWYLSTFFRIFSRFIQNKDPLNMGLSASFLIAGLLFLTQPIYVLPQLIIPI